MAKIKINGIEYETNGAKTILDVTRANSIEVPTFCYNPELTIAANCRMCLVEVAGAPKLLPACQTDIRDGMEVMTESPRVKQWQQQNLEFILLHHPVDCPICDQAGECDLQEHYQKYDKQKTRLWSFRDKDRKPKRVVLGPHVVYDAERCILCTQCIRFCEEVWGERLLDSHWRGDHRHIIAAKGESLDFPYSLMVVEVCPVGAMTSRDFRFKKRVWFLSSGETICPGCATGCAAHVDHDGGIVHRLRPRRDDEVNRAWLCDEGVLAGHLHNDERVDAPEVDGEVARPDVALKKAASILSDLPEGGAAAVLSAEHSTEDNLALASFAREVLKVGSFYLAARPDGEGDKLLRSADKNPNRRGAAAAAGGEVRAADELEKADGLKAVLALGPACPAPAGAKVVAVTARRGGGGGKVDVLLPAPSFAEASGSYINGKGLRRTFRAAIVPHIHQGAPPPDVRSTLDGLAAAMGVAHRTGDLEERVAAIAAAAAPPTKGPGQEPKEG
jgi:NADH-quinone oxidoreductase subunit G